MGKHRAKKERQLLAVVQSLRQLWPEAPHDFVCPICLSGFSIGDPKGATEAHIIPESAGGRETTFLCKDCNSRAGHSLDVWFGEMLYLIDRDLSVFSSRMKHQGLTINDIQVGGTVHKDGKEINVTMYAAHTNPASVKRLMEQAQANGIKTMTVKFPLLEKRRETDLAVLQAAYLTLVNVFGWVPVFQTSLDIVRRQLLDYTARTIDHNFVGVTPTNVGYTFGLAEVDGRLCLFACFSRFVVFLPTVGDQNFYGELPKTFGTAKIGATPFKSQHRSSDTSCALVLSDRVLLWPDAIQLRPTSTLQLAHLSAPNAVPRFTQAISIETLTKRPEGKSVEIQIPASTPRSEYTPPPWIKDYDKPAS